MSKVFTFLAVFLSALFSHAGLGVNARSCSYDCTSTHPSMFGITNFDSGEPKLINAETKAFFPLSYTSVCKSNETKLTPFLQPQHVFVNPFDNFDFVVICPHSSDHTINVFSPNFSATDSQSGLTLVRSVFISSSHQVVGFLVKAGYIFVTTTHSLILYNVETLDLLWEYEISSSIGTVSGLPVIGFEHAYIFAGTAIIKLPNGESVIPSVETVTVIDTPNSNILGYGLLDARSSIYYCSKTGIIKLSLNADGQTYSSYELNLSLSNQQCTAIILSKTGKLMYAAKGVNEQGQFSYSVLVEVSTKFAEVGLSTAVTVATYTKDVINSISRSGWNSGMDPVSVIVLSLDSGVSVIFDTGKNVFVSDDAESKDLARGTSLFHASSKTPIKVKATTSFLGEPLVVSEGEVLGMSDGQLLTFYSPERVYPSIERSSGLGLEREVKYTTAPILVANQGAAVLSEKGVLHLYGTCNRWFYGGSKPEKNPCPVGDLPTPDALPVALLIAAGASSAFCLPMGLYLCRKAKWNTPQKY